VLSKKPFFQKESFTKEIGFLVKTLTKSVIFVFLLAQVFFLEKRKSVKKALPKKLIKYRLP